MTKDKATDWVKQLVRDWDEGLTWKESELSSVADDLLSICELNNGRVYPDTQIPRNLVIQYQSERINDILSSKVIQYIKEVFPREPAPKYPISSEEFATDLSFVQAMKHADRIDLNSAEQEELETLPEVGEKIAKAIIDYRKRYGRFNRLTELSKINGLTDLKIHSFSHMVYLSRQNAKPKITSSAIEQMKNYPTFHNYINAMEQSRIRLSMDALPKDISLTKFIVQEVARIRKDLENDQTNPRGFSPGIRASTLQNKTADREAAKRLIDNQINGQFHGILLSNSDYPIFILELLKVANRRIRIVMFFLTFKDEERQVTDQLVAEIINAQKRGVNIQVILDQQGYGDIPSRKANSSVYEYFRKQGIPVRFDSENIATHSKLVVIDDRHVVIGSHNWTAGSFNWYDEASVYLSSDELAQHYNQLFERYWTNCTQR